MDFNPEQTAVYKSDPIYQQYVNWLKENGCIFPSLDYPAAFWKEGILGVQAKKDIGQNKVFVFVPYTLCINKYKALTSEIGFIFQDEFFKSQPRSKDCIMLIYLIYEKIKDKNSFWYPYFSTVSGINNLTDWSAEDLVELQDELLVHDTEKWKNRVNRSWERVKKILDNYPEHFPVVLKEDFLWAWRVSCTRTFGWDGGMIIPLAGSTNHGVVYTTYESKEKSELVQLASDSTQIIDYSDFLDLGIPSCVEIDKRENKTRLEKFLSKYELPEIKKIWGMDRRLDEFRSSSSDDDARVVADCTSDEFGETEDELLVEDGEKYFCMSSGIRTCFLKGEQVFNAYGRLSNRNLLLDYGFAMEGNRYDTVYMILWLPESGREGLVSIQEIKEKSEEYLKFGEMFGLKLKRLSLPVLTHLRGFLEIDLKTEPSDIETEIKVIEKFLEICFEILRKFRTSLEEDQEILNRNPSELLRWAVVYRIGQKKIVLNQIKMLETLRKELEKIKNGLDLANHLAGRDAGEVSELYCLREYLKSLNSQILRKKVRSLNK